MFRCARHRRLERNILANIQRRGSHESFANHRRARRRVTACSAKQEGYRRGKNAGINFDYGTQMPLQNLFYQPA